MRGSVLSRASVDIWSRTLSTNANGEEVSTYAYTRTDRGYVQPKNDMIRPEIIEIAGLEVVPYTHEAYVITYAPRVEVDRIAYMGKSYHVRGVKQWPTHAHCLLEEVTM